MPHYTGEEVTVNTIRANSPVEIAEPDKWFTIYALPLKRDYTNPKGYVTLPVPKLGILAETDYAGRPQVQFYAGEGKLNETLVTANQGFKPSEVKFKVLSGTMAKKLSALRTEFLSQVHASQFTKTFGFTSGCDPEVFVVDENDVWLPAWRFLPSKYDENRGYSWEYPATKANSGYGMAKGALKVTAPRSMTPSPGLSGAGHLNGAAYWDGVQAEFTVNGAICYSGVVDSIHAGLQAILTAARKINPKAKLSANSVMHIPSQVLSSFDPKYVQLGCEPSFNAYEEKQKIPLHAVEVEYRPAGGHVHLGGWGNKLTVESAPKYVKAMDKVAGVALTAILAGFDDSKRRETYGRAGEYRLPVHGLEYRVLSNGWLRGPALSHLTFDLVRMSAHAEQQSFLTGWKADEDEVRAAINECDGELARKIIRRNEKLFRALVEGMSRCAVLVYPHNDAAYVNAAVRAVYEGIEFIYNDPNNIEFNWNLDGHYNWICHSEGEPCQWSKIAARLLQGQRV